MPFSIDQFEQELRGNILPFWAQYTLDHENGGFYGALTNDRQICNQVERSAVLYGRILWTFSTAALLYKDLTYKSIADRAFDYICSHFWDEQYHGIFWSLDQQGRPVNDRKHTYAQAFSIYGLSAYYEATGNPKSLSLARELFDLVEKNTFDSVYGGNIECRARNWSVLNDMRLSTIDVNSSKSMNTMLHLMEAYTALSRASTDKSVEEKLKGILRTYMEFIIDQNTAHQRLFFDDQWNPLSDHISYGHDIETSWLLLEAAEQTQDPELVSEARSIGEKMAQAVYEQSYGEDGSILYESSPSGEKILTRHWWAHAEAVVGFYNVYEISGEKHFLNASKNVWEYIQNHFIDRKNGDWYKLLTVEGEPILTHYKVGPWDCPYHHARLCFEMTRRLKN